MGLEELIRRGWSMILVTVCLALVAGFVVTRMMPRMYRADTTLLVNQFFLKVNPGAPDLHAGEQLAKTYAALVTKEAVLAPVASALGLSKPWYELAHQVSAVPITGTQLLRISAIAGSSSQAQKIADETARRLIDLGPGVQRDREILPESIFRELGKLGEDIRKERERLAAMEVRDPPEGVPKEETNAVKARIDRLRGDYIKLLNLLHAGASNRLTVVEKALGSPEPVKPLLWRNLLLSGLTGFLIAVAGLIVSDWRRHHRTT